jgi:hypothetical protein
MDQPALKRHHDRSNHSSSTSRVAEDEEDSCVFSSSPDEASIECNMPKTDFQWVISPDPYSTITANIKQKQQPSLSYPTKEYLHDSFHPPSCSDDLTSKKASSFYEQESIEPGKGLLASVRHVFSNKCNTNNLNPSWALIILLLLVILINLPYTKRASVCLVLNLIIDVYSRSFNNSLQLPVKLPVNDVEVKKFLTGHLYKNSLVSSLPIPAPIKLNHHAYIPISRQLQHASALGLIIEPIHIIDEQHHTVTSSNHPHAITPKGMQLLQDSLLSLGYETSELIPYSPVISATSRRTEFVPEQQNRIVSLFKAIFWTDDFDPRTTKNNRGSCWLLCATVGLPDGPHHNRNTFLIALGSAKIDHSEVYETLTKELNDINRNRTSLNLFLKHQSIGIKAHVCPYCFLQDTPETTDCNQTASWKSSHTVLSSYIVDINPL